MVIRATQWFILSISLLLVSGCGAGHRKRTAESLLLDRFYTELAPFGEWMESDSHGIVWDPYGGPEFRPYVTNGHWTATDQGWAWDSGYRWGWAPFHYGRWYYDAPYGWLWQPGYEWSPAWVTWGYADDYYFWAPLKPEVDVSTKYQTWSPPAFYWNGCPKRHITSRNIDKLVLKPKRLATIRPRIKLMDGFNTTSENQQYYATGPAVNDAQRFTIRKIRKISAADLKLIKTTRPMVQDSAIDAASDRNDSLSIENDQHSSHVGPQEQQGKAKEKRKISGSNSLRPDNRIRD